MASGHFFTLSTSSSNSHWTKHSSSEIDLSPIVVAKLICLLFFPATLSDHEAGFWHRPCHELNTGYATRSKTPLLSLAKRKVLWDHFLFTNDQRSKIILHKPRVELWPCHEIENANLRNTTVGTVTTKRTVLCDNCLFTNDHKILLHEPQVEGWPSQGILTCIQHDCCPSQKGRSYATIAFLKTIKAQKNIVHELRTARLAKPRDLSLRNSLLPPTTTT